MGVVILLYSMYSENRICNILLFIFYQCSAGFVHFTMLGLPLVRLNQFTLTNAVTDSLNDL